MKKICTVLLALFSFVYSDAQIDIEGKIKRKVQQRADQKIDQAIDKTLDKTEEGVKDAAKGDKKKSEKKSSSTSDSGNENSTDSNKSESKSSDNKSSTNSTLKTYTTFDFVQGDKIIVEDDFSHVAPGDFPVEWNTNGSGEIVTTDEFPGSWLMIGKQGIFMPDYITELPENFTLQYDMICSEEFSYYSTFFNTSFEVVKDRARLSSTGNHSRRPEGVSFSLQPNRGNIGELVFENYDLAGDRLLNNSVNTAQFSKNNRFVKVSIWRQKQRLRVYLNEEKVLDIPRAFSASAKYNAVVFSFDDFQNNDRFLLSNIRFASGAPDTRSKLITEGKLVTRGILFDSGSDKIKPESYGTLKDIAGVLKGNAEVKVKIIGHTDSDGDDAKNLELSKKRAAAVKQALEKEFGIDASRMQTDGKGESEPTDKNDSAVGKANNRRVEFVKL